MSRQSSQNLNFQPKQCFSARYKQVYLDEYRQSLISSLNSSPLKNPKHYTSHKSSIVTNHNSETYTIQNWSSSTTPSKKPPSAPKPCVVKNKIVETPRKLITKELDDNGQQLYDLIGIGILDAATKLVGNSGDHGLSLAYIRQLKQFCRQSLCELEKKQ